MELESEFKELQNKSENSGNHNAGSPRKIAASVSREIVELDRMLIEKTEMVASLEEKLRQREIETTEIEENYKKYLKKAKHVIQALSPNYNPDFLPNVSTLSSASHEEQSNTEHMEDETECIVCFTQYSDEELRPRSLPCGHTLCTKCLKKAIVNQSRKCPKCITLYFASDVKDIPVNYSLESVIKLLNVHRNNKRKYLADFVESQLPKKQRVSEATKPETFPECIEHQLPVIRRCSTHKSWICQNCMRDEHSLESCKIIKISEELNVKKSRQLALSQSFLDKFEESSTESDELRKQCNKQIKERDEEITCFENIVKRLLEVIQCKKKSRVQLEDICNGLDIKLDTLKSKKIFFDEAVISLNSSETIRNVSQCSMELQNESEKLQLITNEIKQETHQMLKAYNADPESSVGLSLGNHTLSVFDGMYHLHAIRGKATPASEDYCLQIPDDDVSPVTDGILTFLDIAWPGQQAQRIYIKMVGNTARARQHLLLAVGQCGHSYRGLYFESLTYKDQPGEFLEISSYDSAGAQPLLNDVTVNDVIAYDVKAGLVSGASIDDGTDDSNTALFGVYIRDDPGYVSSTVFGTVTSGLEVLRKIAKSDEMEKIKIVDCGVVLF